MSDVIIAPPSLARAVSQAVTSAAVGGKGQAGCVALASAIGTNWRLRVRNSAGIAVDAVFQAALAPSNGVITLPAYTTLNTMIGATIDAGWTVRIGRADDSVYVEGAVGLVGSGRPFVLSANPGVGKGFAMGALTLRFDPALDGQSDWLSLIRASMADRSVTERVSINGVSYVRAQDGSGIPFPDSYANVVSYDGVAASLSGQPTGSPGGDPMFFANGFNTAPDWGWFGARSGHTATQSRIRVSDLGFAVLRKSTRTWQIAYRGMRGWGARYQYLNGPSEWGGGHDLSDPYATYIAPTGAQTIELWPQRVPNSAPNYVDYFGVIDRALYADMLSWLAVCKVRVEGPDRANARFVGCMGVDFLRDDHAGRRYWPNGLPQYAYDGGGSEWQDIRNDGVDQWLVAVGCWELGRFRGVRPPWGDWSGVWPYASPPNGLSWAEIQANPPPDLRLL